MMKSTSNILSFLEHRSVGFDQPDFHWQSHMYKDASQYFYTDLKAHFGCVNAIEFSRNDLLLASGGDDRRVLLWPVAETLSSLKTHTVPHKMSAEHNSNIFCLAFNASDSLLFSGGNDGCIVIHDINSGAHKDTYLCEEAIYCIGADPVNESVFVAASHEGKALIYDIRTADDPVSFAEVDHPVHSVQYNPESPQYIATISSRDTAKLWDIRNSSLPVVNYKYSSGPYCGMSLAFNPRGDRLLVIGRRMPPLVYDVTKSRPVHEFHHAGYYSTCTIKSCCWAGPNGEYICTGSDNFGVYMWKLPAKCAPENYVVKKASRILKGHRSLVNQVRFNRTYSIVASSGVEKIIKAWSPFNIRHTDDQAMMTLERCVYTHEEYITLILRNGHFMTHNYTDASMEEDPKMMAFFDSLVQRELEADSGSDESEEATQRRYDYELSSTSLSSTEAEEERFSLTHSGKGKSKAKTSNKSSSARADNSTTRDPQSDTSSSSDDSAFRGMSPFSEAFVSSMLTHHRGEGGAEASPSPEQTDEPRNTVTMTQLIARRKQQDLKHSLAMTRRKLKREKRKTDLGQSSKCKSKSRVYDQQEASSDSSDNGGGGSAVPGHKKLKFSERCVVRRKKKMERILQRIGAEQVSESRPAPQSDKGDYLTQEQKNQKNLEIRNSLQVINRLRHTADQDGMLGAQKTCTRQSTLPSTTMGRASCVNYGASTSTSENTPSGNITDSAHKISSDYAPKESNNSLLKESNTSTQRKSQDTDSTKESNDITLSQATEPVHRNPAESNSRFKSKKNKYRQIRKRTNDSDS